VVIGILAAPADRWTVVEVSTQAKQVRMRSKSFHEPKENTVMLKNKSHMLAVAIAGALVLGACSSKGADTDQGAADGTDSTTAPVPSVVIDEEIKAKLDVEPGSAIIPGSIDSVKQELGADCSTAVAPLRDLMEKYPSLRQVPTDGSYQEAFAAGEKCAEIDAQQWADFYTKELAGWLYAKTD